MYTYIEMVPEARKFMSGASTGHGHKQPKVDKHASILRHVEEFTSGVSIRQCEAHLRASEPRPPPHFLNPST